MVEDTIRRDISPQTAAARLLRWKWLALTFVLSAVATIYAGNKLLPKQYQATAHILVQSEQKPLQLERYWSPIELAVEVNKNSFLNTQIAMIKSEPVLSRVVDELQLYRDPTNLTWKQRLTRFCIRSLLKALARWDPDPHRRARTSLAKAIKIAPYLKESSILEVQASANSAELSTAIANAVANAYVDRAIKLELDKADQTMAFIDRMIAENTSELRDAERRLTALRKNESLIAVDKDEERLLAKLSEFDIEASRAEADLATDQMRLVQLQSAFGGEEPIVVSAQTILANPIITGMSGRLADAQVKLATLESELGPKHPDVIKQRQEIAQTEAELAGAVGEVFGSRTTAPNPVYENLRSKLIEVATSVQSLRARASALAAIRDRYERQAAALPEKERRYGELVRSVTTKNEIAKALASRQMEARIARDQLAARLATSIKVVQEATVPFRPVRPRKEINLIIGFIISSMIALALAVFAENADRSMKSAGDVEHLLGQPVLTVVPTGEAHRNGKHHTPTPLEIFATDGEPFRRLRTALRSERLHDVRTLLVTSCRQGEGSSTVAANLAKAFAASESRGVLLVDANLRDPSFQSLFRILRVPGLTDLAIDRTLRIEDAVVSAGLPNMCVLPCGSPYGDPGALFSSAEMKAVLDEAQARFGLVILDAPPIMESSDAQALAQQVDGVLLVIQAGNSPLDALDRAVGDLAKADANIVGAVLNYRPLTPARAAGRRTR